MRQLRLAALAVCVGVAALAIAPGISSAGTHGKHGHHRRHHHGSGAPHLRAHTVWFVHGSQTPTTPTSGPQQPQAGPTATPQTAASVQSFSGGVLTIKLVDGTLVSGAVTDATLLFCASAQGAGSGDDDGDQSQGRDDDDQSGGGGQSGDDPGDGGGPWGDAVARVAWAGQGGGDDNDDGDQPPTGATGASGPTGPTGTTGACTTASLAPNALVGEAELSITMTGTATWEKVELVG